jgi:hypothetical protein
MKKTLIFILLITALAACNKTVYVPVESVKTEYRDNYLRDSIHLRDSIKTPAGKVRGGNFIQ